MGDVIAVALIGLVGGAASGLLGVGGGTLFVPAMVLILGKEQHLAQGVSLVVIIPTAISATLTNLKGGYVDVETAKWVTPLAIAFALVGGYVAGLLDGDTLSRIFGVVVLYVGTRTLFTTWRTIRRERATERASA